MRIAVIADIHGNLRALEAVTARIADAAPDVVVNLGDCVSGPLWPAETAAALRASAYVHVRGNHDRIVGAGDAAGAMWSSDRFAWDRLSPDDRAWLGGLPATARFDDVLCVHGVPANDLDYLLEDVVNGTLAAAGPAAVEARLGGAEARLVLCGHSHQPRVTRLPGGGFVVNPGSVGCPGYLDDDAPEHVSEAGSPHARYAIIDLKTHDIDVALCAAAYDWDEAARLALANGRREWARALATGFIRER